MGKDRYAIEALSLSKSFGDVVANDAVSLRVPKGTVHGLVGENGAGKSTLLKMLFGFYTPDSGELKVDGNAATFASPSDAMAVGIGMVHQHFMLVETFTVLENIIMGAEGGYQIGAAKENARTVLEELEATYGFDVPLETTVSDLSVGLRQQVEILKALYRGADVLILDEPTAVLTPQESDQLFALMEQLKAQGKTLLFVTHKLHEIMRTTDDVTVMRGGKVVGAVKTAETTPDALAERMVGTKVSRAVARASYDAPKERLTLSGVSTTAIDGRGGLSDVSLGVCAGEVLGIAGVAGNGQTELLDAITGLCPVSCGTIAFGGVTINAPGTRVDPIMLRQMGMSHVAEDRLRTGAVEGMTAWENAILGYQRDPRFLDRGLLRLDVVQSEAERYFEEQDVRPRSPKLRFGAFSGGNQQKLVIGRETAHNPDLLVIGQPTRGVDIGAVTRIHDQITALRNEGKALLVVSADLDELLAISDRIAVMNEGRIVGTVNVEDADERTLGLMMAGEEVAA